MAAAILLIMLGVMVMAGWHTHNIRLIQVDPAYVPMQYNTAVGFLLAGLGLSAISFFNAQRFAAFCGVAIFALGFLTLGEYLFNIDLMIDQWLMRTYVIVKTSHPGRMAPNTALCFTLSGLAFILFGLMPNRRRTVMSLACIGTLILGLSLVAISGYWMGLETAFGWGALTRMAVHSAIGFVILGTGFLWLAWYEGRQHKPSQPTCISIPIAIGVMTMTIMLWQALQVEQGQVIAYDRLAHNLLLVFGTVLALALAWAINRSHAAKIQAHSAEAAQIALQHDIAERKLTEAALTESEARFRNLFENAAIGIARVSLAGHFLQINQEFCRIVGYTQQEMLSPVMNFQHITFAEDIPSNLALRGDMLDGSNASHSIEKRYIRKDGSIAWVHLSTSLLRDEKNNPLYFINAVQDITERKHLQAEIERQAHTDFLTGLFNRRHFMEQAEIELARALRYRNPFSIAMLDIDHFKHINDTHGHKIGDIALQRLSIICQETLRESDMVARIGGEEFAILLPQTEAKEAIEVMERLRKYISTADIAPEISPTLRMTVSIGIVTLMGQSATLDEVLHLADEALYEAKNSGRNRLCEASL